MTIVPCAIQQDLAVYPSCMHWSALLTPNSQPTPAPWQPRLFRKTQERIAHVKWARVSQQGQWARLGGEGIPGGGKGTALRESTARQGNVRWEQEIHRERGGKEAELWGEGISECSLSCPRSENVIDRGPLIIRSSFLASNLPYLTKT